MERVNTSATLVAGAVALALAGAAAYPRLLLSRAKHRSLTGHSKMAKRVAGLLPGYAYDEERFFGSAGAPDDGIEGMTNAGAFDFLGQ